MSSKVFHAVVATKSDDTLSRSEIDGEVWAELEAVVHRTFLRGYAAELLQGFTLDDYAMPSEAHKPSPGMTLPYFNTPEFFAEMRDKVSAIFNERATAAGFLP